MNPQAASAILPPASEYNFDAPDASRILTQLTRTQLGHVHPVYSGPVPHLTLERPAIVARSSDWSISGAKRGMDVLSAAFALVLLAPVFAFVCVLVAASSPGKVFFSQKRVGRLGQLFKIYKFRTMRTASHAPGPACTRSGDPRITRIGKTLRKFKLDELPQFYNVLRGDMSLVGPRPKLPQHEGMHMPFRPGVTGAATLAFRSEEEMLCDIAEPDLEFCYDRIIKPLKSSIDSEYMERATLFSDLSLLLKTAAACALPRRYHPILQLKSPDLGSFNLEKLDLSMNEMADPS